MTRRVIITGGLGYIGSHVLALLKDQEEVLVVDDLSNSRREVLKTIEVLAKKRINLVVADVADSNRMVETFDLFRPDAVVHLAGKKSVPESLEQPVEYYETNVGGTVSVLKAMEKSDCSNIIFSSSATVYGSPEYLPIDEKHNTSPTNPYGMSKRFSEAIIEDWCSASSHRKAISLRYFNPIGAHISGRLFENGPKKSSNIMPVLLDVAARQIEKFTVYGEDFKTIDGSGVRDYIHVMDLADAHLKALRKINRLNGYTVYNIGTGRPTSVFEFLNFFEQFTGVPIPKEVGPAREGDQGEVWASPLKANRELDWKAVRSISEMCTDSWNAYRCNKNSPRVDLTDI